MDPLYPWVILFAAAVAILAMEMIWMFSYETPWSVLLAMLIALFMLGLIGFAVYKYVRRIPASAFPVPLCSTTELVELDIVDVQDT